MINPIDSQTSGIAPGWQAPAASGTSTQEFLALLTEVIKDLQLLEQ